MSFSPNHLLRSLPRRYEFVPGTAGALRTWVKNGASYVVEERGAVVR